VTRAPVEQDKPEDLDELWTKLNSKGDKKPDANATAASSTSDTIKINRSYEFAGHLVTYFLMSTR
jgi:hypothetical protein